MIKNNNEKKKNDPGQIRCLEIPQPVVYEWGPLERGASTFTEREGNTGACLIVYEGPLSPL